MWRAFSNMEDFMSNVSLCGGGGGGGAITMNVRLQ